MSNVYTDVFGGENVHPAQLDYVPYVLLGDVHSMWPFEAYPDAYVAASKIDIQALSAGLKFYMPRADLVSVGQDCLITNRGAFTFIVTDVEGSNIATIAPGIAWFLYVTDNSTAKGLWRSVQFGAGVSSASAGSLAGAGLRSVSTLLDQNLMTLPLLSDYTITQGDRAKVVQNKGGSVNWTSDTPFNLGNGFFYYLMNSGTGTVTFDPPGTVTIDGQTNKVFQPGENAVIFSDGTNFASLGYGRSLTSSVTGASISLAPGGTRTLTGVEVAAQVQDFVGALTSNSIVNYGTGVGYWFVQNATNGPFSTTARVNALDPGVVIPQGSFSIIRSNGVEMELAFTAATGSVSLINTQAGELVGGPITSTGTIGLANTPVVPGTYGGASLATVIALDQKGRATAASHLPIQISTSQVTGLDGVLAALLPPGTGPIPYAGSFCPPGWLLCDGQAVSRTTYAALFAAIGTLYGAGDVSGTTFNLPDMRGVVAAGMDLMPGSSRGNANNLSIILPSTVIGGAGGNQIQPNFTPPVDGTITGTTFGGLAVVVDPINYAQGNANTGQGVSFPYLIPDTAAGGRSQGNANGTLGVTGTFSGVAHVAAFSITQPTRVFIFMIKT